MMSATLPAYVEAPIREKLQKIVDAVMPILPQQPEEIFVSRTLTSNAPNYPSVWLFTKRLIVEIRNPLNQSLLQFEMARLAGSVDWIRLYVRKFDFHNPGEDSELDLEFTTADGLSSTLSGSGEACDHLMSIYRERFLPNLVGIHNIE